MRINSFAKIFDDSIRAADLFGPNARNFSLVNISTTPAARGSSGPTTVRSTRFSFANLTSAVKSLTGIATFSAISPVPAFPGAQKIWSARGDCRSFHVSACSRPPLPMTRILIASEKEPEVVATALQAVQSFQGILCTGPARWARQTPRWQPFALFCGPRFRRQNPHVQFLRVPNDREACVHVNLFADQNLVQMMHGADWLAIERDDQVALAQAGSFAGAVLLD